MTEPLLTAQQVAELLGFSPATIVDWAEAEKLPGFRIGGRLRFRWSEVETVLEEGRFGPSSRRAGNCGHLIEGRPTRGG